MKIVRAEGRIRSNPDTDYLPHSDGPYALAWQILLVNLPYDECDLARSPFIFYTVRLRGT
jgi:hypothetical protein